MPNPPSNTGMIKIAIIWL